MRRLATFLTLIFFLCIAPFVANAQPTGSERIHEFNTAIQIQKSGVITVREEIKYDFGYLSRRGIFRDIPEIAYRENNNKYVLKYNVLSVTDENNQKYKYELLHESDHLRVKIGDANKYITGLHTYIITYEVRGALNYFPDHVELYWNSTGTQWGVPIDAAVTTVTLPQSVTGENLKVACYTGSFGSTETACDFSTTENTANFAVSRPLNSYEGLTVVVGFPNSIVDQLLAEKFVPFEERWYGKLLFGSIMLAAAFWYLVYPVWIVIKWLRYGRDPRPAMGETRAWFEPPVASGGRKLTPVETGSLLDESVDNKDISGMVVDLARRGYLKIEERNKKDFYLVKRSKASKSDALMPFEQSFLDQIFATQDEVKVKGSKLYPIMESVKSQIYTQMVDDGFFPKNPSKTRTFYGVMAVLGLTTFNIPLALVALIFGLNMVRKTLKGAEAAAVGRSLKNFLSSQERQLTFQASKQMMFEKLLPFAVAFGVEKVWADRFKDIHLKQPEWYSSSHMGTFRSAAFISSLDSSLRAVSVAGTPPRSSSSGSGFSGGGSSGGGGGGGGGGSW